MVSLMIRTKVQYTKRDCLFTLESIDLTGILTKMVVRVVSKTRHYTNNGSVAIILVLPPLLPAPCCGLFCVT